MIDLVQFLPEEFLVQVFDRAHLLRGLGLQYFDLRPKQSILHFEILYLLLHVHVFLSFDLDNADLIIAGKLLSPGLDQIHHVDLGVSIKFNVHRIVLSGMLELLFCEETDQPLDESLFGLQLSLIVQGAVLEVLDFPQVGFLNSYQFKVVLFLSLELNVTGLLSDGKSRLILDLTLEIR